MSVLGKRNGRASLRDFRVKRAFIPHSICRDIEFKLATVGRVSEYRSTLFNLKTYYYRLEASHPTSLLRDLDVTTFSSPVALYALIFVRTVYCISVFVFVSCISKKYEDVQKQVHVCAVCAMRCKEKRDENRTKQCVMRE
jgi:hypothetical protein